MFVEVVRELDAWIIQQNEEYRAEDMVLLPHCEIRLVGQTALLEAKVKLPLALTNDVDVLADYPYSVQRTFETLLEKRGLVLDPVGHEAWMPPETQYDTVYDGALVTGRIAQADYVLLSKALKAPQKNRVLLIEYLAVGASPTFLKLARRYKVDLEQFL